MYLEVEVQDVHLVHVLQALTDLPYEQHRVQLRQVVVLIDDAVKQLPTLHTGVTESRKHTRLQARKSLCVTHTHTYTVYRWR